MLILNQRFKFYNARQVFMFRRIWFLALVIKIEIFGNIVWTKCTFWSWPFSSWLFVYGQLFTVFIPREYVLIYRFCNKNVVREAIFFFGVQRNLNVAEITNAIAIQQTTAARSSQTGFNFCWFSKSRYTAGCCAAVCHFDVCVCVKSLRQFFV